MTDPDSFRPPQDIAAGGSGSIPVTSGGSHVATRRTRRTSLSSRGEPLVWLTGGAVAVSVLMIVLLLVFVFWQGLTTFWPSPLVLIETNEGRFVMGEPSRDDTYSATEDGLSVQLDRTLYKTGNYDLTGEDFVWVSKSDVAATSRPEWGMTVERQSWGNAYGTLESLTVDGETFDGPEAAWAKFQEVHPKMRALFARIRDIEKHEMGGISEEQDGLRLELRAVVKEHGEESEQYRRMVARQTERLAELQEEYAQLRAQTDKLSAEMSTATVTVRTADGKIVPADRSEPAEPMQVWQVVRTYPANQLGFFDKLGVYFGRWWEYLSDDPREANAEGGVYPAIIGTVLLTMLMVIVVVPIGVIAAIYLREYARQGLIVSIVRISVNNLAGVPSIVYGVFGLGFFCYIVGGWIDGGPEKAGFPRPPIGVYVLLAIALVFALAAAIVISWLAGRLGKSEKVKSERSGILLGVAAFLCWLITLGLLLAVVFFFPGFDGFYNAKLPDPTVGKSAMIWASLTLSLLTLPVVIVASEEALAAVPKSMREGAYACGASKWQTIWRIVLPRALPGIMTGMILAIARGAGEVAPLMLVGAVKLAPELPLAADAPFFGTDRSFMHLGFHIYDLGFQSRNSEAAKSMVYTTTLLLIGLVVALNLLAIRIRSRLQRSFAGGQF